MPYSTEYLRSRTPVEIREMADLETGPVNTGHAGFDRAANSEMGYVGTGNVSSSTQYSSFVRDRTRTWCNGRENPEGHLQDFDLKPFGRLPAHVEKAVREAAEDLDVILYEIGSPTSKNGSTIHGYLLTDRFYREIEKFPESGQKNAAVMEAITPHLVWDDSGCHDPTMTAALHTLTSSFDLDDFEAPAAELDRESAHDAESCRSSGLIFQEDTPFSSWAEWDPPGTMTRAETPAMAAALLAIRHDLDPDWLEEWIADRPRPEDDGPAP